jgi:hypothetical protein
MRNSYARYFLDLHFYLFQTTRRSTSTAKMLKRSMSKLNLKNDEAETDGVHGAEPPKTTEEAITTEKHTKSSDIKSTGEDVLSTAHHDKIICLNVPGLEGERGG